MEKRLYMTKDIDKVYKSVGRNYEKNIKDSLKVYTVVFSFLIIFLALVFAVLIKFIIDGFMNGFMLTADSQFIIVAYVFFILIFIVMVISIFFIEKSRKKLLSEGKSRSTMIFSEIYSLKNLVLKRNKSIVRTFYFNIITSFIREHISQIESALVDSYYPLQVNKELGIFRTIDETLRLISANKLINTNSQEVVDFLDEILNVYPLFFENYLTPAHVELDLSTELESLDNAINARANKIQLISAQLVKSEINDRITSSEIKANDNNKSKSGYIIMDFIRKEIRIILLLIFFIVSYIFAIYMGVEVKEATGYLLSGILPTLIVGRGFYNHEK